MIFFGNAAIEVSAAREAPISGAKYELMRIFQNLIKNALEAGAKKVAVTFSRDGDRIGLVLADDGAGMDAERVRRALGGGFTSKESGMGLGLSICRHLLNAHGATFQLESQPGPGHHGAPVLPRGGRQGLTAAPSPLPPRRSA